MSAPAVDPNKLNHIFNKAGHNLGPLLAKFGGNKEALYRAVEKAAQYEISHRGQQSGLYDITVKVAGQDVGVTGTVMRGLVRIGTFFVPQ
jgi:hypothetical protein